MKIINTITVAILTAIMTTSSVSAYSINDNANIESGESLDSYLNMCIPKYISAQNVQFDGILSYSKSIALYDFEKCEIIGNAVFVLDDGEPIGKIELFQDQDGFSSTFDTAITDDIKNAYEHGDEIALGYYGDNILLYSTEYGYDYIDGVGVSEYPSYVPANLNEAEMSCLLNPYAVQVATVLGSRSLNVRHVHNITVSSVGQCWAACAAMLSNYCHDTDYDAYDIYNIAESNGVDHHSSDVFTELGYSYTIVNGVMSPNDIFTQLSNGRPISISIKRTDRTATHSVVICGIVLEHNLSTLTVNDPNYSALKSFVINVAPTSKTNSINYLNNTYDYWYKCIYLT